jgi:hypothetical protein
MHLVLVILLRFTANFGNEMNQGLPKRTPFSFSDGDLDLCSSEMTVALLLTRILMIVGCREAGCGGGAVAVSAFACVYEDITFLTCSWVQALVYVASTCVASPPFFFHIFLLWGFFLMAAQMLPCSRLLKSVFFLKHRSAAVQTAAEDDRSATQSARN